MNKQLCTASIRCFMDFKDGGIPKQWFARLVLEYDVNDTEESQRLADAALALENMIRGKTVVDVVLMIELLGTCDEIPTERHPFVVKLMEMVKQASADGLVINVVKTRIRVLFKSKTASSLYKKLILDNLKALPLHIEGIHENVGSGYNYSTQTTLSTVDPMTMEMQNEDTGAPHSSMRQMLAAESAPPGTRATEADNEPFGVTVSIVNDPMKDDGSRVLRIDSKREVYNAGQFVKELRHPLQHAFAQMRTGKLSVQIVARVAGNLNKKELEAAIIDQIAFDALVIQTK